MSEYSLFPLEPKRPLSTYAREVSNYFDLLDSVLEGASHNLVFVIQYATDRENAEGHFIELDDLAVDCLKLAATAASEGSFNAAKSHLLRARTLMHMHLAGEGNLYAPGPLTEAPRP